MTELLRLLRRQVADYRAREHEAAEEEAAGLPVITLDTRTMSDKWTVERVATADGEKSDEGENDGDSLASRAPRFIVCGAKIEKFARRTNFDQFEAVNRLRDIMRKMGITHELLRQGATGQSVIQIGEDELTLVEQ